MKKIKLNSENWKEEFRLKCKESFSKGGFLTTDLGEKWEPDVKTQIDFISSLLSSQAHALKEQMKTCVPEKDDDKFIEGDYHAGRHDGFNDCRQKTLSAIESIEI